MKAIFLAFIIPFSLLANEYKFNAHKKDISLYSMSLFGGGIVSMGIGHKVGGKYESLLPLGTLVAVLGFGSGAITLASNDTPLNSTVKLVAKDYKKIKKMIKTSIALNKPVSNEKFNKLINQFDCYECESDIEKIKIIKGIIVKIDEYTKKTFYVNNKKGSFYSKRDYEKYYESADLKNTIMEALDNNNNARNFNFAMTLAYYSLFEILGVSND